MRWGKSREGRALWVGQAIAQGRAAASWGLRKWLAVGGVERQMGKHAVHRCDEHKFQQERGRWCSC